MVPQCTALNVSDQARCEEIATSVNGLFCSFHSRQCQGLYRGYKNRNARLDSLERSPPKYFASSNVALANQTFEDVDSEDVLREIYDHLALKYALLDRVIRARKLHHSRFFALHMDYGHQNYLDILSSRRNLVMCALERLERRVADVLYKQQKWFKWVRQCQDEEETARENEKKRVKKEAALFRRHEKDAQSRIRELRAKENLKRQEVYLDEAYNARLSDEEEAEWDPIEDVIEDERENYVDLIKHILLMTDVVDDAQKVPGQELLSNGSTATSTPTAMSVSKSSKKFKKSGSKALTNGSTQLPDKATHDTKTQVRERLKKGVKLNYGGGMHVAGTIDNPAETHDKSAPVPDDEIDRLLEDMGEVKHLLFCRLLLAHASVLPAAVRANNVDEFLADKEVTDTDLRDIALRLDNPGLQEIRDACADLARGEEEEDHEKNAESDDEDPEVGKSIERLKRIGLSSKKPTRKGLPDTWAPQREKQVAKNRRQRLQTVDHTPSMFGEPEEEKGKTLIDFGDVDDEGKFKSKKMRVKICGRYIYNYPSERAISRGGWLQFCLIAKSSDLHDAIKLCRHWDEFFDLNILANFQYFPAANWLIWKGDRLRQQLLQLGLIPYMQFEEAKELSGKLQSGSRGQGRRVHSVTEVRNFMCANIKRNDPITRRFLQYLSMQSCKVVVLIRDAKTSKILRSPPDDELWLNRHKAGVGRASKNEWTVGAKVGPKFFEQMEEARQWHFGFNEYYDVYIWDYEAGQPFGSLYSTVSETLFKAHRFCSLKDLYNPAESILRTLTRDPATLRTRDIKPGEDVLSIWDETQRGYFATYNHNTRTSEACIAEETPASLFYNEVDVLEDAILFPEEVVEGKSKALYKGKTSELERFVSSGPAWERFVHDLDTDEELSDLEDSEDDESFLEDENDGNLLEDENDENLLEGDNDSDDSSESSFRESKGNGKSVSKELSTMFSEEEMEDLSVISGWEPPTRYGENVESEFWVFMDREKSKGTIIAGLEQVPTKRSSTAFKRSWHAADLHPGAAEKRKEAEVIVKQMVEYIRKTKSTFKYFRTLRFLDVHPDRNRRTGRDACEAYAMAKLFFPTDFLSSEQGILHKDSLLLNQAERARNPPARRPHTSNKYQPKSFFEEWDTYRKERGRHAPYPTEWDVITRPIIAKLYKAGIIGNSYIPEWALPGKAMAAKGPTGERDLYIDLRCVQDDIIFPRDVQHPPSKEYQMTQARRFAKDHPGARFAALRLWSAPHFYPLMVGLDRRHFQAFEDAVGRAWEWNFVPKDMPFSETSIHHTASLRLKPYKRQFGEKVVLRRDLFLVMGVDEEDLLMLTSAVIFAVQTEPWRLEIDLWRSFGNVDLGFLEGLGEEWLD